MTSIPPIGADWIHIVRSPDLRTTYLEWEGLFRARPVSGVTSLKCDDDGLIAQVTVNHRPYDQAVAFAALLLPAIRAHRVHPPHPPGVPT